ncbi:uncharacterized protein PADG_11723 [Paracoccidioides brasiliensis Pb18]|uniref:Uncharacterized protein n=1 Tax=Paracoccidioides brasiliensis (strain Pb18) TaxID=502780 RepID=A0A0A0HXU4_PARBD|nr:uncharacterized protein PADG_11723 [Paracoccidioides brasiliensis Pb18]KGM92185.1 hypothetical protein PADG_11723 [Paracoccidioides brasiliensis Pb18]ODH48103.1 hypothetical protein GX48_05789 [Paracoccidioides brasiliensis]
MPLIEKYTTLRCPETLFTSIIEVEIERAGMLECQTGSLETFLPQQAARTYSTELAWELGGVSPQDWATPRAPTVACS